MNRLERIIVAVCHAAAYIGSAVILLLVFLVGADAALRNVLGRPIAGVVEVAASSTTVIMFFQLPLLILSRRLIRTEFLDAAIARRPALQIVRQCAQDGLGLLLFLALTWVAVEKLGQSYTRADFFGVRQVFTFPKWPIWLAMVIGSVLSALSFGVLLWRVVSRVGAEGIKATSETTVPERKT